ncbi:M28 family peptidase [Flagellimonas meridianipacifica]|uniref:Vacuolar membrane protease n=1 Tax=Flagellimonas meridianipacifica TaxID=1080225 RepID=A0A2T0MI87_9FLAO|nr:M28 family peptidase [Allomuricauda pacifica]PRX57269.1 peptidase M28-like protein [Allomuricauda pacifica]
MKRSGTLAFFFLLLAVYWSFRSLMPKYEKDIDVASSKFSTDRALFHVENLSKEPHSLGFPGHERVRAYIISELKKLGLKTSLQEGFVLGDNSTLTKAKNILARIEGTAEGKALLLMSHYDSHPHSSFGASDAGSGVATILEGIRAYLAQESVPKNDIILLITDAEELGLNGAELFVNEHPWAKDVGLVLNFEARGSGGPSYMLVETNRGNARLINEFIKANPKFPVANSLAYSIYKMLPNDTDLTVFREDGDIEGFNFAFIDDHFDYHTALDVHDRLDKKTLAHQGSYLMPLLDHFSQADLTNLKSLNDLIYVNLPFYGLVAYPFEWIFPMLWIVSLLFMGLLIYGFRKKQFSTQGILRGILPALIVLIINGAFGYFAWTAITWWYPEFKDMLHGFTYNGHTYIAIYTLLACAICFWVYHRFRKTKTQDLLVFPILLWTVICWLVAFYLKGASFFVIPVFGVLAALLVYIKQEKPNPFLLIFLSLPAIFIYAPFIKMFPVGLGLKMLIASTLFCTLLFFLVLPYLAQLKNKNRFAYLFIFLFAVLSISGHIQSDFTEERPKPSSLMYVHDVDKDEAIWATYDHSLIEWNSQYLGKDKKEPEPDEFRTIPSKYRSNFTYVKNTQIKAIESPLIDTVRDTIIGNERVLELCLTPRRDVNRLDTYTNPIHLNSAKINNLPFSSYYLEKRKQRLATHFISDNDYTELELSFPKDSVLELTFYESSNDLLTNPLFTVPERPKNSIPMPFVLNDAILIIKTLKFE